MKIPIKKFTITSVKFIFISLFFSVIFISCTHKQNYLSDNEEEKDMYDEAAAAQNFEFERTKDPALGYVPKERLTAAYNFTERSKQIAMRSRITAQAWVERGPTADVVGVNNANPRDGVMPVSAGRVRAIWVDLNDASGNTVWVGAVAGGLWKTTNFKTSATWVPVNDFFTNMSISSICQDPLNKNILYFCTGEAFFNFDAVRGNGVYKSSDNGLTWNALSATSTYISCSKILCDAAGNIFLGAVGVGLLRSTAASGGAVWTNINPSLASARTGDFEISSTGRFHLSTGLGNTTSGAYRYTDNPLTVTSGTWTSSATSFPFPSGANCRVELACLGNTLYALPSNNSAEVTTIYKSTDGGNNWAATGSSPSLAANTGFTSGQAWYCLAADINPANANNVIVGSLNCYATLDGGATWLQRTDWAAGAGSTGQYVHADQQIIKWNSANDIIIGTDGGIFCSGDGGVTFNHKNSGLRIKQFFSCAFHPTLTDYFLAGAQDNGCHQFTTPGLNTTTEITGGDGAFVHIDQNEAAYQYASYVRSRYRRSTNSGTNWSSINFFRSGPANSAVDFGSFINPTDYDNTANILYCGSSAGEFFRWSTAKTTSAGNYFYTGGSPSFPTGADVLAVSNLSGTVTAVTVSPYSANTIYLGTNASQIIKINNANSFSSGAAGIDISTGSGFPATATIGCIATGTDDNNIMAVFTNYGVSSIWITNNGGTNWTAIEGNLPDMPVRWAVFDPTSNTKAWIATETGVWTTTAINGSSTIWTASPGFPTVRTDMIKYRAYDQTLVAATHGRGLWTQSLATVLPINNFVLRGKWNNESVELAWDFINNSPAISFDIESSTNGTYFTKAGTSITTKFIDQSAADDIYYRIKSKSIYGSENYSNVIHLTKNSGVKNIFSVTLYPNPVNNYLKIAFASAGNGKANYHITTTNGQVVWKKEENITNTGEYLREWTVQDLKPGLYYFTILYNGKKVTQKFTKL